MTARMALDRGSTTVKKYLRLPQPSIWAASQSSAGRLVWKNVRDTTM